MRLSRPVIKRARIEIVPMIDTIFFLLVFFMITSLAMVNLKGKKVILPESETAKAKPVNQITVSVDKNGLFYVGPDRVAESEVATRLSDAITAHPESQVLLNCDKGLPVTYFLKAYDYAKRANAAHVMVATSPRGVTVGSL